MQQHEELDALILSEVRKKRTTTMTLIIWNLIYGTNEPINRGKKKTSWTWRIDTWLPRGRWGVGWTWSLGLVDANYSIWSG